MGLFKSFFSPKQKESLDKGLKKTNKSFLSKLGNILVGKSKVDVQVLDDLEEVLISSDVGVKTTLKIIDKIESRVCDSVASASLWRSMPVAVMVADGMCS